mmetsp:Transcript_27419/g.55055  ORF Transcript_27419/g.55055 Transcript_27419/m.55055 type:complete len:154 (+) Transcript_27419:206-667(+)
MSSQDKSSETTPSIDYIDGPMLPHLLQGSTDTTIPQTTTSLVPIITPPLATQTAASEEVADAQQYLLVPNSQRIIVRSAHHGKRVCTLVPKGDESIHAVTLVWLPVRGEEADTVDDEENDDEEDSGEWVVVAGCSDGTLQEWSITKVSAKSNE